MTLKVLHKEDKKRKISNPAAMAPLRAYDIVQFFNLKLEDRLFLCFFRRTADVRDAFELPRLQIYELTKFYDA